MATIRIKEERKERQWTVQYVAKQIGVSNATILKIEAGKRLPSFNVLVKLLDLFGYDDPRKLFEVVENTKKPDGNQAETNTIKEKQR